MHAENSAMTLSADPGTRYRDAVNPLPVCHVMTTGTYTRGGFSAWWVAPMHILMILLLGAWSASVAAFALKAITDDQYPEGAACGLLSAGFLAATWALA